VNKSGWYYKVSLCFLCRSSELLYIIPCGHLCSGSSEQCMHLHCPRAWHGMCGRTFLVGASCTRSTAAGRAIAGAQHGRIGRLQAVCTGIGWICTVRPDLEMIKLAPFWPDDRSKQIHPGNVYFSRLERRKDSRVLCTWKGDGVCVLLLHEILYSTPPQITSRVDVWF
jgi:hypothetical protein